MKPLRSMSVQELQNLDRIAKTMHANARDLQAQIGNVAEVVDAAEIGEASGAIFEVTRILLRFQARVSRIGDLAAESQEAGGLRIHGTEPAE
jgi:hypothetical protein